MDTPIHLQVTLSKINSWTILRLPKDVSAKLPSRGQVMVKGTFNGIDFRSPLEPDGDWSHWFKPEAGLLKAAKATAGDTVKLTFKITKEWPEPDVPKDLKQALASAPKAHDLWRQVTPMAHWEWVRWIRSTNKAETRQRRVEVAISKLNAGTRRPCCWNRNLSTEPSVSKNGVLLAAEA